MQTSGYYRSNLTSTKEVKEEIERVRKIAKENIQANKNLLLLITNIQTDLSKDNAFGQQGSDLKKPEDITAKSKEYYETLSNKLLNTAKEIANLLKQYPDLSHKEMATLTIHHAFSMILKFNVTQQINDQIIFEWLNKQTDLAIAEYFVDILVGSNGVINAYEENVVKPYLKKAIDYINNMKSTYSEEHIHNIHNTLNALLGAAKNTHPEEMEKIRDSLESLKIDALNKETWGKKKAQIIKTYQEIISNIQALYFGNFSKPGVIANYNHQVYRSLAEKGSSKHLIKYLIQSQDYFASCPNDEASNQERLALLQKFNAFEKIWDPKILGLVTALAEQLNDTKNSEAIAKLKKIAQQYPLCSYINSECLSDLYRNEPSIIANIVSRLFESMSEITTHLDKLKHTPSSTKNEPQILENALNQAKRQIIALFSVILDGLTSNEVSSLCISLEKKNDELFRGIFFEIQVENVSAPSDKDKNKKIAEVQALIVAYKTSIETKEKMDGLNTSIKGASTNTIVTETAAHIGNFIGSLLPEDKNPDFIVELMHAINAPYTKSYIDNINNVINKAGAIDSLKEYKGDIFGHLKKVMQSQPAKKEAITQLLLAATDKTKIASNAFTALMWKPRTPGTHTSLTSGTLENICDFLVSINKLAKPKKNFLFSLFDKKDSSKVIARSDLQNFRNGL